MKLTIDTQHDSFEDIQKVLHILTGLIQHKERQDVTVSNSPPVDTTDLMSMFSGSSPAPTEKTDMSAPPDFSSFLNLTKKEEKKEPIPKIEFF